MGKTTQINGLPIKDAKRPLDVRITAGDVKEGAKKNAQMCAAALAICRMGHVEARVHTSRTYVKDGNKWLRYATPPALGKEIVAFDRGGAFEPGHYVITPLSASQKAGARETRAYIAPKRKSPVGRKIKKRKPHVTTGVRGHFAG